MGRRPRIQFEGATYHVFSRGNRRERIHHTDRDYRTLERYVIEAAHKTGVVPRAWYPMPNHFHALIETPFGNISEFMQIWSGRYARYYNRVYEKIGHLFQGRFGSRLVQKDAYLKELIRYVHLQGRRSTNLDPFCERYSSHRFYIGETCDPAVFAWIEPMLKLFGQDMDQARREYAKFLSDGLENGNWESFYRAKTSVLGDDGFRQAIEQREREKEARIEIPKWRRREILQEIIGAAVLAFGIQTGEIASSRQQRNLSRIRQAIAFLGRRSGSSVTDIARVFERGQSSVSMMLQTAEQRAAGEIRRLQERMESLNH